MESLSKGLERVSIVQREKLRLLDEVLRGGDVFTGVDELVKAWLAFNERQLARVAKAFGEIRAGGTFDLTTLSVAQRQLRNLVLTTTPSR